jgi:DNA polymerase-3 subunit gamma/tau
MVLVRLAYVADLPVPADLVRALTAGEAAGGGAAPAPTLAVASMDRTTVNRTASVQPAPSTPRAMGSRDASRAALAAAVPGVVPASIAAPEPASEAPPSVERAPMPQSFADVVVLFDSRREAIIAAHLKANVRLVSFEPGRIEIHPTDAAPGNLTNQLGALLGEWTGARWIVAVSQAEGAPTLAEAEARRESSLRNEVAAHPLVRAVLDTFPGAMIASVRQRFVATKAGMADGEAEGTDDAGGDIGDADDVGEDGTSTGEDGS